MGERQALSLTATCRYRRYASTPEEERDSTLAGGAYGRVTAGGRCWRSLGMSMASSLLLPMASRNNSMPL